MCYNIVTVYGTPHARDKEVVLVELVHIFSLNTVRLIVGGDFNLMELPMLVIVIRLEGYRNGLIFLMW